MRMREEQEESKKKRGGAWHTQGSGDIMFQPFKPSLRRDDTERERETGLTQ